MVTGVIVTADKLSSIKLDEIQVQSAIGKFQGSEASVLYFASFSALARLQFNFASDHWSRGKGLGTRLHPDTVGDISECPLSSKKRLGKTEPSVCSVAIGNLGH